MGVWDTVKGWFTPKPSTPSAPSTTPAPSQTQSTTKVTTIPQQKTATRSIDYYNPKTGAGVGVDIKGSGAWSRGGSVQVPTYTTTSGTGTGYNPATQTQVQTGTTTLTYPAHPELAIKTEPSKTTYEQYTPSPASAMGQDILLGVQKAGLSAKEFWINFYTMGGGFHGVGKQTSTGYQSIPFNVFTPKEQFTLSQPMGTAGTITYYTIQGAELLAGGYAGYKGLSTNIKTYGTELGIKETISGLSPYQFSREYVYTPSKVSGVMTEKNIGEGIISQKFTGGQKVYYGLDSPSQYYSLTSEQQFKIGEGGIKTIGYGYTKITAPQTKYIGGEIFTGTRTTQFTNVISGNQLGTGYLFKGIGGIEGQGFKGNVLSKVNTEVSTYPALNQKIVNQFTLDYNNKWLQTKVAGVTKPIEQNPDLFSFRTGIRTPIYSTTKTDTGFVYAPSGYKANVQISGFGKTIPTSQIQDIYFQGGKVGGRFQDLQNIQSSTGTSRAYTLSYAQSGLQYQPQIETPRLNSFAGLLQNFQQQKKIVSSTQIVNPIETPTTRIVTIATPLPTTTSIPRQFTPQGSVQITTPTTTFINPPTSIPSFPTIATPKVNLTNPFPSMPFVFSSDAGSFKKRKIKGKQQKQYTPSYEAFIFNIRGKQPKGIETGMRLRPITKGFSFVKMRKF